MNRAEYPNREEDEIRQTEDAIRCSQGDTASEANNDDSNISGADDIDQQIADFLDDGRLDDAELNKLVSDIDGYYDQLPPEQRERPIKHLLTSIVQRTELEATNGPIPPPKMLAGYEAAVPGAGDRILTMAESQQAHRHAIETKVIDSNISLERLGVIIGGIISAIVVVGSMALIALGKSVEGMALVIGELVALVAVFVKSQSSSKKELEQKRQQADSNQIDWK